MVIALNYKTTWPRIKDRLEAMRISQRFEGTLDDIFALLSEGKAFMYGNVRDQSAFAIVRPIINAYTEEAELFIIAASSMFRAREGNIEALEEVARGLGAKRLRMHSRREGFKRTGWTMDTMIYSREVA
jgi:predicted DNA-binding protein